FPPRGTTPLVSEREATTYARRVAVAGCAASFEFRSSGSGARSLAPLGHARFRIFFYFLNTDATIGSSQRDTRTPNPVTQMVKTNKHSAADKAVWRSMDERRNRIPPPAANMARA